MNEQPVHYEVRIETGRNYTATLYVDHFNRRLRIDDYRGNLLSIADRVRELSKKHALSKIIWKARESDWLSLIQLGYVLEGILKSYFSGNHAYNMSLFLDYSRKVSAHWLKEDEIIEDIYTLETVEKNIPLPKNYIVRPGTVKDVEELSLLYKNIFKIYPTPVNEPNYLLKVIKEGTIFYVVEWKGKIISAASAEVNRMYYHAELTDCATYAEHRKHGLMKHLLIHLEKELMKQNIYCTYSLSRALSFGMNRAFYQLGYQYNGRLTNNCYIFDKLEDMNIWVKDLSQ